MQYDLSEALRAELKARMQTDRSKLADALCIYGSFDSVAYLTLDGRILIETWDTGPFLIEEATDDEACSYLTAGAKTSDFPELLELLPARPAQAEICSLCQGTRWARFAPPEVDDDFHIVCDRCSGRGWILPQPPSD